MTLRLFLLPLCLLPVFPALSQSLLRSERLPTPANVEHTYLNINAPAGEIFIKPSISCGSGYWRVSGPDTSVSRQIRVYAAPQGGHLMRTLTLNFAAPQSQARSSANMRVSEQFFAGSTASRIEVNPDPSAVHDLFLDLGVGACRMDLSGLSLENVNINSAFSDVVLTYNSANQIEMKEMEIHAANATVILKHPEYARAGLVTVQNDMGETRLILGGARIAHSNFYLKSGVGPCFIVIHPNQPVKLILRGGFFSTIEVAEEFQQVEPGVFVNAAALRSPDKVSKIICDVDFGNISVMSSD
ncbi:MAG: hypothetical protein EAZ89_13850 [Bacteroidetes bacterium]|nr:MAG: hypothetical protein EAZ89_13850 [Bacteroidota bacterium]